MSTFSQSDQIGELVTALAKAQMEFQVVVKDSDNPFYHSKYADLASNINASRPLLNKHGIVVIQANFSLVEVGRVGVRTSLHHGDQWIACEADAPAIDTKGGLTVQTMGSAWTYLRRYTYQGILALASEDDDGNSLSNGMTEGKKPAQIEAEQKWDKIDPPTPINNLNAQLQASNKIEAEKRAAQMRNEEAEKSGNFSIDGDVLTCKIVGIQKKQGAKGDFMSVTFNGRLPNGANFAQCFDKELFEALNSALDKECRVKLQTKGQYVNVKDVLWIDGVGEAGADALPEFLR